MSCNLLGMFKHKKFYKKEDEKKILNSFECISNECCGCDGANRIILLMLLKYGDAINALVL